MLHTTLLTIKENAERKTAGSMELVQVQELNEWVELCGWEEEKGLYTRCRRCDENGTGQESDGENLNRFMLEPIAYKHNGKIWGYKVVSGCIIETLEEEEERKHKQEEYDTKQSTVTLTNKQWSALTCYLIMSTNHREGEAKAWEELAEEKEENGEPKFKNAVSNAKFWKEIVKDIKNIQEEIDTRRE